jgi:hypothetical protein
MQGGSASKRSKRSENDLLDDDEEDQDYNPYNEANASQYNLAQKNSLFGSNKKYQSQREGAGPDSNPNSIEVRIEELQSKMRSKEDMYRVLHDYRK